MAKASKNQRVVKSAAQHANAGERSYLIPLNSGKHAYVTVNAKLRHVSTSSDEFAAALKELGEGTAPKVRSEIERFNELYPNDGWSDTLVRLETAGVI